MKPFEVEANVWYVTREGRQIRAIYIEGNTVRYENQRGDVGDMTLKKFSAKCIFRA